MANQCQVAATRAGSHTQGEGGTAMSFTQVCSAGKQPSQESTTHQVTNSESIDWERLRRKHFKLPGDAELYQRVCCDIVEHLGSGNVIRTLDPYVRTCKKSEASKISKEERKWKIAKEGTAEKELDIEESLSDQGPYLVNDRGIKLERRIHPPPLGCPEPEYLRKEREGKAFRALLIVLRELKLSEQEWLFLAEKIYLHRDHAQHEDGTRKMRLTKKVMQIALRNPDEFDLTKSDSKVLLAYASRLNETFDGAARKLQMHSNAVSESYHKIVDKVMGMLIPGFAHTTEETYEWIFGLVADHLWENPPSGKSSKILLGEILRGTGS